jgi:AraC family transcriptional regulator
MLKQVTKLSDNLCLTTLNANGLVLTELDYRDVENIPPSKAKNPIVELVIKGNYVVTGNQKKYECSNGHLLYIKGEDTFAAQFINPHAKTFAVEIDPDWLARFSISMPPISTRSIPDNSFANNLCHMLWQEYIINDEFTPLAVQGIFLQFMAGLLREQKRETMKLPEWVVAMKRIIREQHSNRFTLKELSKKLDIHPVHLSREFPKYFQCSLSEYLRRIKVKEAVSMMSDGDLSLTDIAYQCGFSDQSHFTRIFKRMYNVTPSQYRQMIS